MFWTAFILGFAGSLHCMGMCSPLAMSITNMSSNVMLSRLLYNAGRLFTYGILGSAIASIGINFPLVKYQSLLSILLGISLLVIGFSGVSVIKVPLLAKFLGWLSVFLKKLFSRFIQRKGHASTFTLGTLNGLLPCGLSFLALSYCLTLGGPLQAFFFMGAFGIGTLPVMLGFTGLFHWVVRRFNLDMSAITTSMLIVSGLLLIARVFLVHMSSDNGIQQGIVDIVLCR